MASKLSFCLGFMLFFILCGMGAHVAGMLTDYWLIGIAETMTSSNMTSDDRVLHVNMGLYNQILEYANGTIIKSASSLNLKEENYLFISIAGMNTLMCLILLCKAVHVFIGIVSFIFLVLLIIVSFYSFQHTVEERDHIQDFETMWPELKFSWSFILMFGGLLLNVLSTIIFLTLLLILGEKKASKTSGTFVAGNEQDAAFNSDKTPIVSTITSYENTAFNSEAIHTEAQQNKNSTGRGNNVDHVTRGQATPIHDAIISGVTTERDIEVHVEDDKSHDVSLSNKPLQAGQDYADSVQTDEDGIFAVEMAQEDQDASIIQNHMEFQSCRL